MCDFIQAALPWILMGLFVAVSMTFLDNKKEKK
jgi:hypothetical protein